MLYPYLMAAFGVNTVSVISGLAACWLTALLLAGSGIRRPMGPALLASQMLWFDVAAGRTTFALGVAFARCLGAADLRATGAARLGVRGLATMASPVADCSCPWCAQASLP
ncbi:hypothetical protein [Streptomyces sp. NPDC058678]|uniref:hypothetical protein n=1 Tax=Streptomyces sp. NPDC058678 TaxID=3346595 RepID=UPI003649E0B0